MAESWEETKKALWTRLKATGEALRTKEAPQATQPLKAAEKKRTIKDFDIAEQIGHGSYSQVLKVTEKSSKHPYALKRLNKSHIVKEKKTHEVQREKDTLIALADSKRAVHLIFSFQDNDYLYYVLDLCVNGDLQQLITRFGALPFASCRFFTAQLVDAIAYCHSHNIVHRDIKPDNCLLDHKLNLKLADFASSRVLTNVGSERKHSFVGTPQFVAPEVLTSQPATFAADWWSLGSVLYVLATGKHPFEAESEYLLFLVIASGKYDLPAGIDERIASFISKLFVLDQNQRLGGVSADGAAAIKADTFFADVDWDALESLDLPLQPYSPWADYKLWSEDDVMAVPYNEGEAMIPDDCPFTRFLEGKPVTRWAYCFTHQGLRVCKLVAIVLSEGNLWFFDQDTLEPYERSFLQKQDFALALSNDMIVVQTDWRRYYLRFYRDDDVDYVEHPEHMAFVSEDSAAAWVEAINTMAANSDSYVPQHVIK